MAVFITAALPFVFLQTAEDVRTETSFSFQDSPEPWVFFLLILPAIVFFTAWLYRKEKSEVRPAVRTVLVVLRSLLFVLIVLFLFRPVLLKSRIVVEKPTALLLLDDSASMRERDTYAERADPSGEGAKKEAAGLVAEAAGLVAEAAGRVAEAAGRMAEAAGLASPGLVGSFTRRELVERIFSNPETNILGTIEERYDLRIYAFGSSLNRIGGLDGLRAEGESTRLGDALAGAVEDFRGRDLSALVLVSDGRSNRGRDPRDAARLASNRQIPVHTVGVGDPSEPRNVELTGVNAPTVALTGDEVTFRVNIRSRGYEGRPVVLTLREGGERAGDVLASRDFILKEGGGEQQEQLYWRPEIEGDFTLRLSIPPLPGEQDEDDNVLTHVIRIESAHIRVLYVEGYPRWEYRFLKNILLRAENFEVQVVLQSADLDFIQESSENVPPLVRVPKDLKELMEYHVIVFGDVDPTVLGENWEESRAILKALKNFVEAGGGFLMQAGELHSPSSYRETPVADILPVVIGNIEEQRPAGDEGGLFRPKLENYLNPHEILLLEKDKAKNRRLWEDPEYGLPGFLWYLPVERAKPGTEVLARHPAGGNRHGNHVILATRYHPAGRTIFLAVDSTWRWRFPYGDRYMEKFWRGMVRYLAQNKLRRKDYRYELYTDRSLYDINERIQVTARVRDVDYRLSRDPVRTVKIMDPEDAVEDLLLNRIGEGEYSRSIVRSEPGVYQLWIPGEAGGVEARHALTSITVNVPRLETENPVLDRMLLQDVSRISGGTYRDLCDSAGLLHVLNDEERVRRISDPERRDLWSSWWTLLLFVALFAAEWILRKRNNLL